MPVVMVDTSDRPDIDELIRVHRFTPPGDCSSRWATALDGGESVFLILKFARPLEADLTIEFNLERHSGLVDNILRARGLYLLHGLDDDTFTTTTENQRILVELPPTGFERTWEGVFRRHVAKIARREGASSSQARRAAADFIADWRALMDIRL